MAVKSTVSSIDPCKLKTCYKLAGVVHESFQQKGLKNCFCILNNPSEFVQAPEDKTRYIQIFESCIACGNTGKCDDKDSEKDLPFEISVVSCHFEDCTKEIRKAFDNGLIPDAFLYFYDIELKIQKLAADFFIFENPSKLVLNPEVKNNYVRIFRNCIICKKNKFHDDDWYGKIKATPLSTSCGQKDCLAKVMRAIASIPYEFLYVDYPKS